MAWQMASEAKRCGWGLTSVPVELDVCCVFPVPRSWPSWRRAAAAGCLRPGKPDADNLAKLVKDAGSGVLWIDDAQVVRLMVEKLYARPGEEPCTLVTVRRLDPLPVRRPAA